MDGIKKKKIIMESSPDTKPRKLGYDTLKPLIKFIKLIKIKEKVKWISTFLAPCYDCYYTPVHAQAVKTKKK